MLNYNIPIPNSEIFGDTGMFLEYFTQLLKRNEPALIGVGRFKKCRCQFVENRVTQLHAALFDAVGEDGLQLALVDRTAACKMA